METISYKQQVENERSFLIEPIDKNWSLVSETITSTSQGVTNDEMTVTRSRKPEVIELDPRVVSAKNLSKLKKSGVVQAELGIYALTPEEVEAIRKYGWCTYGPLKESELKQLTFKHELDLDRVKKGELQLVRLDGSDHKMYTLDHAPLTVGIHFDYISARMNNGHYDLKKVLSQLKRRKDIVWLNNDGYVGEPEILEVPYYNNETGCRRYLHFFWGPDNATYRKVINHMNSKNCRWSCIFRAIRELDALNIEQHRREVEYEDY